VSGGRKTAGFQGYGVLLFEPVKGARKLDLGGQEPEAKNEGAVIRGCMGEELTDKIVVGGGARPKKKWGKDLTRRSEGAHGWIL